MAARAESDAVSIPSLGGIGLISVLLIVLGVVIGGNPFLPLVGAWLAPTLWGLRRILQRRTMRLAVVENRSEMEPRVLRRLGRTFVNDLAAAFPHAFLVGLFGYYMRWGVNWSSGWLIGLAGIALAVASLTLLLILVEAASRVGLLLRAGEPTERLAHPKRTADVGGADLVDGLGTASSQGPRSTG